MNKMCMFDRDNKQKLQVVLNFISPAPRGITVKKLFDRNPNQT